ncbi:hypothetical protein [Streptomyces sp. NPDC059262]|uniref:hypothetical protein n=1 Tax=Streptomyces sp. NPDC059262 TaxID=3346797 RepID=UPI0036B71C6C
MNRSPEPASTRRPRRTAALLLRAVGALVALALTVVALPWLLWQATVALAPGGWDGLQHLFTRQDTGSVALLAVCVIGWLAWASFILSLLLEIPAQLRGVRAPRIPGIQVSQRAAAALVGSLLVLLPTSTALAATPAEASPRAETSVAAPAQPGASDHATSPAATATGSTAGHAAHSTQDTYTVRDTRPAESLWSIAERLYGNGEAYTHIAQANEGKAMAEGQTFHADAPIRPGWILQLPAEVPRIDAQHPAHQEEAGLQTQTATTKPAATSHVVEDGESISEIAKDETGNAANWPQLYEASRGAQPKGLPRITDPNLIFPGQRITIPTATAPHDNRDDSSGQQDQEQPAESDHHAQQPPRAGTGSDQGNHDSADKSDRGSGAGEAAASPKPTAEPSKSPASPTAQPSNTERPASPSAQPGQSARPSAPATASSSASTPGHEHSPAASPRSAETGSPSVVSTRTAVGVFALLAAALTGTLALRRLRQRRSRQPGQSLPQTVPAPVEAELELAAGDGSAGVLRLHAALSALAHQTGGTGPSLRAARITADGVQVLPADVAAEPVAPFTTSRAGWWELPHAADLPVPEDGSATAAPYPALVTLGAAAGGDLVLANLPALEVLLVDGEPADRTEVIAALAAELTLGPCAHHIEVVACAMGSMGADLAALGVQYLPDPRLAATEFAGRLLEAHQEPEDSALPYVLLCAGLDDDVAWQFAQSLDKAQGLVPAVLVMPATASAMFPDAETLDATTSKPQRIDTIGCDLVLQRLDAASLAELAGAYRQSSKQPVDADGVWEHIPPETIPLPDPAPPTVAVPHPGQDIGDTADPRPAAEEQAAAPVGFQALLGPAADPGQTPLRAVQAHPSPSTESGSSGAPPERIGPRFRIPPSHTILTPERVAAIGETDKDKALSEAGPNDAAPRLRILGGLHVEHAELEPRLIELTAHLLLRPGSSAQVLCEDLGNREPWSTSTLNSRLRALRNRLGTDPDGALYVPQRVSKASPYALADTVRCDWNEFERLATLGVSRGEQGLPYLERALALVSGVPLGEHASSWMVPLRTYMQERIADVASTLATYRTLAGPHQDFPSARQACATGLSADSLAETLHRAMLKIEAAAGNRTGLRTAVAHWQDATRHLSEIDTKTQALVDKLLSA